MGSSLIQWLNACAKSVCAWPWARTVQTLLRLIIREGLAVSSVGIALGFALTYGVIRTVSRFVVALPSMDLLTFCVVPLVLGAVILLACYIPALRAARVDPMVVLRGL